jgi:UTP--glucose-1-phosphate uridylyltransferase
MKHKPAYLIIPAAGLGTRMRVVNPDIPKEMLPLGEKPAIQYAAAEGLSAGIKNIIIIINRNKEIIRQYFEERRFRERMFPRAAQEMDEINTFCSITFLYQKEPLGESDAIGLAEDIVGNCSLAILYPDNVYFPAPGALKILTSVFLEYKTDITALMEVTEENAPGISNSGRVDLTRLENGLFRLERFYPKGTGNFVPRFIRELRTCGIALSGYQIFEYIKRLKPTIREKEFTDAPVRKLMLEERGLLGYCLPGTVFDIGTPRGYEQCLTFIKKHT